MAIADLLDPNVLLKLSNIELVAKTVVDGVLMGLHKSPFFGFSLEFAEYRPYVPGDDPRFIDWNVYSRTDRTYIKRYLGETNTHLVILLDISASMGFQSKDVSKLQYGKWLAASLAYLASRQHDAVGAMMFDEEVRDVRPPAYRPGHFQSILHMLDRAEASTGTDLELPFDRFQQYVTNRGLVVVISDFYYDPKKVMESMRPLVYQGQDVAFFHVLDPAEIEPDIGESTVLEDMETGEMIEVSAEFARSVYPAKMRAHMDELKAEFQGAGADYIPLNTSQPLDEALRGYLTFRQRRR